MAVESLSVALCPCLEEGRNPGGAVSLVHNLAVKVRSFDPGGRKLVWAAVWKRLVQIPYLLAEQVVRPALVETMGSVLGKPAQ